MPLSHSRYMTPAEGGGASTLHVTWLMTGGGASTRHHMCVDDRCELADDRGRG